MTEKEILNTPFEELAKLCQDPVFLAKVFSIAYNWGRQDEQGYNRMFRGYTETSIKN